jgi:hypothetical protein
MNFKVNLRCSVNRPEKENGIIGHQNYHYHFEPELTTPFLLQLHQPACLLHDRPSAILGLHRLLPVVFVPGKRIGAVEEECLLHSTMTFPQMLELTKHC